jgi:hypothetical protein
VVRYALRLWQRQRHDSSKDAVDSELEQGEAGGALVRSPQEQGFLVSDELVEINGTCVERCEAVNASQEKCTGLKSRDPVILGSGDREVW